MFHKELEDYCQFSDNTNQRIYFLLHILLLLFFFLLLFPLKIAIDFPQESPSISLVPLYLWYPCHALEDVIPPYLWPSLASFPSQWSPYADHLLLRL